MADFHPVRVLIVDDEPLARRRVAELLRDESNVAVIGQASSGAEAVAAIRADAPDVVFLDVQMSDGTGLDVVREIGAEAMPVTVFVTAYDQYALRAFDAAAIDYLVKPFDDERFEQAFRRARRRLALEGVERLRVELLAALQRAGPGAARVTASTPSARDDSTSTPSSSESPAPNTALRYAERIAIESHGKVRAVAVVHIDYITASGSYAELHVRDGASTHRYVIRETMQALEERLDPSRFLRVHRSVIVRLDLVEVLHRGPGGDYEVQLKGGTRLRVSRSRHEALERWLGLKR